MDSPSLLSVHDYHRAACAKLPKGVLDYYEGGALDEITLRENSAGWERLKLYYHVLAGVGRRDLGTTVLGQPISTANWRCANGVSETRVRGGRDRDGKRGHGGEDLVHSQFVLEHRNGVGSSAGGESALVSALHLQGPRHHRGAGATSRSGRSRSNRRDC